MSFRPSTWMLPLRSPPPRLRRHGHALLYWLVFLLVLEPGNIFRANQAGISLDPSHELLRIGLAAMLGASVTPLLFQLTEHFPVLCMAHWRRLSIHALGTAGLGFGLIAASCLLAAWVFDQRWLPTLRQVQEQLSANFTIVFFALTVYSVIAHLAFLQRLMRGKLHSGTGGGVVGMHNDNTEMDAEHRPGAPDSANSDYWPMQTSVGGDDGSVAAAVEPYLRRIETKMRGRSSVLELSDVDWIETQGNYIALHAGTNVHLVRETLVRFEARLNPRHFVRIHRRMIVAVDRVLGMQAVANGDTRLLLTGGSELRASRSYRCVILQRLDPQHVVPA